MKKLWLSYLYLKYFTIIDSNKNIKKIQHTFLVQISILIWYFLEEYKIKNYLFLKKIKLRCRIILFLHERFLV